MITGGDLDDLDPAKETRDYYARAKRDARSFAEESEKIRSEYQSELKGYLRQRFEAQCQAAAHASNIGLRYHPRSNRFTIPVIPHEPAPGPNFDPNQIETVLRSDGSYGVSDTDPDDDSLFDPSDETSLDSVEKVDKSSSESGGQSDLVADENLAGQQRVDDRSTLLKSVPPMELADEGLLPLGEKPKRPDLPQMPSPPAPPKPDEKWKLYSNIKSAIAWAGSLAVGAFVGFGLKSFIGASIEPPLDKTFVCVMLGMAVILGLKLVMDLIGYETGAAQARKTLTRPFTAFVLLISFSLIGAEAILGGQSLLTLASRLNMGVQTANELQPWQAYLITICISTATLLFSGFTGYQKGLRSLTTDDAAREAHEHAKQLYDRECARIEQEHERDLQEWQDRKTEYDQIAKDRRDRVQELEREAHIQQLERMRAAHDSRMALVKQIRENSDRELGDHVDGVENGDERRTEFASMRKLPDFQAMLKYMSLVDACSLRIEELEKRLTGEMISRGHRRAELL